MNENLEHIEAARCRLQAFLAQLRGDPAAISSAEQLEAVRQDVALAGSLLSRETRRGVDETLSEELRLYQVTLEGLRTQLPELEKYLMVAREQLQTRRLHIEAVRHWAAASKESL